MGPPMMTSPVRLIAGPPCAGKSTYVDRRRAADDLLLDTDRIYEAMSGRELHDRAEAIGPYVWAAYWAALDEVSKRGACVPVLGRSLGSREAAARAVRQGRRSLDRA